MTDSVRNGIPDEVVLHVNKDASETCEGSETCVPFLQKLVAEVVGTYFLIFAGCASVVVNKNNDNVVTLPGIAIVWGLVVVVMIYSVGHISGAHFNPAVTFAFATTRRFPLMQEILTVFFFSNIGVCLYLYTKVPAYIAAQLVGATLASGTLRLIFTGSDNQFPGTLPEGSNLQAFVFEFIITFYLMFVISGIATDSRAEGGFAGIAVGSTLLLNVMIAGSVTGGSMNPARSLGPAFVHHEYRGIWIYLVSPILGAVAGAWVYNIVRFTNKSWPEITKRASCLKGGGRGGTK